MNQHDKLNRFKRTNPPNKSSKLRRLITQHDKQGNPIYRYQCRECGPLSPWLSEFQYDHLPEDKRQESIILLLPSYLDGFISLFTGMGFSVIHSYDPEVLETEIKEFDIDLAIEWQHGPQDFQIRDLIQKCKKEVPILLTLNWNGRLPPNFWTLGYQGYISVPWEIDGLMSKFCDVLPESKKPILRDLWEKARKRSRGIH